MDSLLHGVVWLDDHSVYESFRLPAGYRIELKADPFSYIEFLYRLHILHKWMVSNEAVFLCRISRCNALYFSFVNFSEPPDRHRSAVASVCT